MGVPQEDAQLSSEHDIIGQQVSLYPSWSRLLRLWIYEGQSGLSAAVAFRRWLEGSTNEEQWGMNDLVQVDGHTVTVSLDLRPRGHNYVKVKWPYTQTESELI